MIKFVGKVLFQAILAAAWLMATTCLCAADWKDYVDDEPTLPPVEEIEDDPAWEKYAFDLPFADNSGRLSFNDLARSGDPFVLFWWLSQCPMCHLQMPYIEHLQNQVDEHGLALSVVSICIDSNKRDCLEVIRDKEISFPVLVDERARRTDGKFDLSEGTPMTYIFGKRGVFIDAFHGFRSSLGKDVLSMLEIELPTDEEPAP